MKSPITTHILDTMAGTPAAGVGVALQLRKNDGEWKELARGVSDSDGRIMDLLPPNTRLAVGTYRLIFETGEYFRRKNIEGFYPRIAVEFEWKNNGHYHLPLLLSPFGYVTYRGS